MSSIDARCTVTMRPTLTPERLSALAEVILNRLWPDNRGGIVMIHKPKLIGMLRPLQEFVATSGIEQRLIVIREGMVYRFEDAS